MKRFLAFFLSFVIVFSSTTAAYAVSSAGGWSAVDVITAGATNTINATKTAGGKALKSAVTVAPSAVKVGKHLIKGGGSAALLIAVPQLLGDAVDWVLDPENNAIKYKDPDAGAGGGGVASPYVYKAKDGTLYPSAAAAAQANCDYYGTSGRTPTYTGDANKTGTLYIKCDGANSGTVSVSVNPDYDPDAPVDEYKYLPIETVAAQVISNAEAGDPSSQEAVKATALEGFAAGEHDAALEAAATESEAGTENPPDTTDPENPPKPNEPVEPFDPAGIISAINALKNLLAGILSAITSLSDFFTAEPEPKPEDNTVDIEQLPNTPEEVDISFGGACPADLVLPVQFVGQTFDFRFSYSSICNAASIIKPVVLIMASLSYVFIVSGTRETE